MLRRLCHHLLRVVLQVHPGEELRVALMLAYSLAVVGGVIITGQTASRALFLSSLPQSAVPYKFIVPPLVLMLTSALLTRVTGRLRTDRLIGVTYGLMLLGTLGFWLALQTDCRHAFWLLCSLFVYVDVVTSVVILQFWNFAGDIFDSLEAKRLFGLISGGSTIANVVFGALLTTVAAAVAPDRLLFVVMGSLALCLACVALLGRRHADRLVAAAGDGDAPGPRRGSLGRDLSHVMHVPLVRLMGAILIMVAMVSSIGDYQLDLGLQHHYGGDSQGMVGFLGRFRLWAGCGAGILQFLLAGRLMARFGVVVVLLLLPVAMMLGGGAILVTGGVLWAAAAPRACDVVLKYSINDPAFGLLFLPLDATLRGKARTILDGILKPPMVSALGLIFLWMGQRGPTTIVHWAYIMLGLVAVWGVLVLRAGREYVAALSQSIRFRRLDPDREKIDLTDERAIRVIRQTLHAPEAPRVVHALTLLSRIPKVDWTSHVVLLLAHADPEVRVLALRHLAAQGAAIYADEVVARLRDGDESVRAEAVEALCALGKLRVIPRILPFLEDPSPRIRGAAVLGLIKHTGLDGFLHAGEHLKAMLNSDDPAARLAAARVLGALQVPTFYHPLLALLEDPSVDVRVAAIRAAGRVRAPELIPPLLRRLSHPLTCWYATDALDACLGPELARLEDLLDEHGAAPAIHRQLVYLLRRHPGPQSVQLLLRELQGDDDRGRAVAAESLLELHRQGVPVYARPLRQALRRELRRTYELRLVRHDLREVHPLTEEALEQRVEQGRYRLLLLLDLLYPEVSHDWLGDSLGQPASRDQATAVELLENLLERDVREQLIPLLAGAEAQWLEVAAEQLHITHRPQTEHLRALASSADEWLRSCALHVIGVRRLAGLCDVAATALEEPNQLVRESAAVALLRLPTAVLEQAGVRMELVSRALPAELTPSTDRYAGDIRMALSTLEKVFFLKGVPLFEDIAGEDIVGMVPILHEVTIPQGETFIREGEEGDALYIIVAGEVRIRTQAGDGLSVHAREVIGERSVLTQQPRSADCTAVTDVVALRIDKKDFWKLMAEQPKITIEILKVLVERYI